MHGVVDVDNVLAPGQVAESSAIPSGNADTGRSLCFHWDVPLPPIFRQSACAEARENSAILGIQQVAAHAEGVHNQEP